MNNQIIKDSLSEYGDDVLELLMMAYLAEVHRDNFDSIDCWCMISSIAEEINRRNNI